MNTIDAALKKIIPGKYQKFDKLTKGTDPYYFQGWSQDTLNYWFYNKNRTINLKKVFMPEMQSALSGLLKGGQLSRQSWRELCPSTNRSGPCGFAVMVRCFEYLGVGSYGGYRSGLIYLTDLERARQLLGQGN